jgi:transposase InsO family protein
MVDSSYLWAYRFKLGGVMPWKVSTPVDERLYFVQTVQYAPVRSLSSICRKFGISRTTGYKWLLRYQEGGLAALYDQDRTPHYQPARTPNQIEDRICRLRRENPTWGARKIRHRLLLDDPEADWPAWRTIHRILMRHDLVDQPSPDESPPPRRFERAAPNELWQMDIKGWFNIARQGRCYPITILDDHSRFCLGISAARRETKQTVWLLLEQTFRRYGLPQAILTDNGASFIGSSSDLGLSHFRIRLYKLGIKHYTGRPRHPQTQGKLERFHRTLKEDLLKRVHFQDHQDAQHRMDQWIDKYNHYRPHEALDGLVPAQRYQPSDRYFTGFPHITYPAGSLLCRVNKQGMIQFQGKGYFVSKTLKDETVRMVQKASRSYEIYFKELCIKKIRF